MKRTMTLFCALLLSCVSMAESQTRGPKVFISVDMEGIWGVVHANQVSDASPEYGPARKWMAGDYLEGFKLLRAIIALAAS